MSSFVKTPVTLKPEPYQKIPITRLVGWRLAEVEDSELGHVGFKVLGLGFRGCVSEPVKQHKVCIEASR